MQEFLAFAAAVVLISMSGVMSPGPLFASNLFYGIRHGAWAGLKIAIGHAAIELPLVMVLGAGIVSLEAIPQLRASITVLGAAGLFAFAGLQIRSVIADKSSEPKNRGHGPILAGVILSGLNPFFIIWWLTIGSKLISDSMELWSAYGILVMFALHIWMDFAWLGATALLASKGSRFLSDRSYKAAGVAVSGVLIYFGVTFLADLPTI